MYTVTSSNNSSRIQPTADGKYWKGCEGEAEGNVGKEVAEGKGGNKREGT